ncbi:CDC48 family AAA ATPase [archaeon]
MADIKLKVQEAMQNDVGRGIVRIDTETREALGLTSGDIVQVKGTTDTVGVVWQCYPQDEGLKIIRMDGLIRQNSGVGIGDYVKIEKTELKPATKITLAPSKPVRFSPGFESYVQKRLIGRPLIKGDRILIGVFGTSLVMIATKTTPKGFVQITQDTQIELKTEPIKEIVGVPQVTYEDIGGVKDEVHKVREMIEIPLKHPELFERLGIEPPKGVLLHGPPGTGKTLLAKAVANESDANFISIQGPEIISKFVGEAEERLRQIFKQAEENAPTIIFIDEIDAIAPKRGEVTGEVEKRVVAQLLASMDGLQTRGNVVVIAATNRVNAIDEALRRPGRFDREIELGVPDRKGRKEILQIHTRNMPLEGVDLDRMADITHGYVGADVQALAKEAAMKTLRRLIPKMNLEGEDGIPTEVLENLKVTKDDFMDAFREVQPSAMREVLVEVPNVKWKDIGGLDDVKKRLKEAIEWPIKNPKMFTRLGIRPPKGIFLFGPPGSGKTMLAKAVATESETNFIVVKGPELLSKWVGESERGVREIFRKARLAAPVVILFDEIDALAPKRGMHAGSAATETVVNQLLTELDGVEELKDVVILATSNRPDIVDPSLLRPGRFDRMIFVPAPDAKSRLAIFEVHTKKMPLAKTVKLETLASSTDGFSGADIEGVCREAAMNALRHNKKAKEVTEKDFEKAMKAARPSIQEDDLKRYHGFMKEHKSIDTASYIG